MRDFVGAQDLIITLVDVARRLPGRGAPRLRHDEGRRRDPLVCVPAPVIVIGCQQPTILADIPQARTYINTYDSAPATLDVLVDELMAGPEVLGQRPHRQLLRACGTRICESFAKARGHNACPRAFPAFRPLQPYEPFKSKEEAYV